MNAMTCRGTGNKNALNALADVRLQLPQRPAKQVITAVWDLGFHSRSCSMFPQKLPFIPFGSAIIIHLILHVNSMTSHVRDLCCTTVHLHTID